MIHITGKQFSNVTTSQEVFEQGKHFLSSKKMMCESLGLTFSDNMPDITWNTTTDTAVIIDYDGDIHKVESCVPTTCTKHIHYGTENVVRIVDNEEVHIIELPVGVNVDDVVKKYCVDLVGKLITANSVVRQYLEKHQQHTAKLEAKVKSLTATNSKLQSEVSRLQDGLIKKEIEYVKLMRAFEERYMSNNYIFDRY